MKKDISFNKPTACLALADGTLFFGKGFGSTGKTTAELCFNTSITGYQEECTHIILFSDKLSTTMDPNLSIFNLNLPKDYLWIIQ